MKIITNDETFDLLKKNTDMKSFLATTQTRDLLQFHLEFLKDYFNNNKVMCVVLTDEEYAKHNKKVEEPVKAAPVEQPQQAAQDIVDSTADMPEEKVEPVDPQPQQQQEPEVGDGLIDALSNPTDV